MRRYYLQSGLWMSVLTVLIFGGLYVAADLNATAPPSNALNIDGEFWSDTGPGFALDKMSARSTKIALGPNANAVVGVDIDASGNQMNDGNTSGTAVAGTDVVVEIFISGLAGPIVGGVVTFDTDKLTVKSAAPAMGFFALGTTANTASFGAVPSGTLTNDYFGTVTLSPVEGVMASTEFTVGVSVVNLAPASNPTDTDNITTAMMSPINFNSSSSPDFDGDGTVGFSDFLQFAGQFGARQGDGTYQARYDLDGDGAIDFSDFLIFVNSFGTQVPPSGGGGGGSSNTYSVGESLPNFPSGFFVPAQVSKASFQFSQGRAVLGFQNGGLIELQDGTTYTCIDSGGCDVEGGRVTKGKIRVTTGSSGSGGGGGGGSSGSPDLIVESPSVNDNTLTTGQSFMLSVTVRNQGNGSSAATTLRYYRSSDATISTSDTEVGTDSVSGLSASGTSAESISLNAPSSAGTYYYGACVENVTGESNTDNNCSDGVSVTVTRPTSQGFAPVDQQAFNSLVVGKRIEAETYFTDFESAGRFMEGYDRNQGSYTYLHTGANTGTLTQNYDAGLFGGRCTILLTFTSTTTGTLRYTCDNGIASEEERWQLSNLTTPIFARANADTLIFAFLDTWPAGQTRAYDFQLRQKTPQGSWDEGCITYSNESSNSLTTYASVSFFGLELNTAYEMRYRYRNSSSCNTGSPGSWSVIVEGTTPETGSGSSGGGGGGSGDSYTPLEGLRVSNGRIQYLFFSAGRCISLNGTINGVRYTIHTSKWQKRSGASWVDIPGTERTGEMCSYSPTSAGEYRLVVEMSINGVRGKYTSENTLIVN